MLTSETMTSITPLCPGCCTHQCVSSPLVASLVAALISVCPHPLWHPWLLHSSVCVLTPCGIPCCCTHQCVSSPLVSSLVAALISVCPHPLWHPWLLHSSVCVLTPCGMPGCLQRARLDVRSAPTTQTLTQPPAMNAKLIMCGNQRTCHVMVRPIQNI